MDENVQSSEIIVTRSKYVSVEKDRTIANFARSSLKTSQLGASEKQKEIERKVKDKLLQQGDDTNPLNDTIEPPFNLDGLAQLTIKNTWNHACIKAKVSNLIGSGWRLTPSKEHVDRMKDLENRIKELEAQLEADPTEDPAILSELLELRSEKEEYDSITEKIRKLFHKPNNRMTIVEISENAFIDREGIGQGFWEISVNALTAEPDHIYHLRAASMLRLAKLSGWVQILADGSRIFYKEWGDWNIYDKYTGKQYGYFVTDDDGVPVRNNGLAQIVWLEEELPIEKWANAVIVFYKYNPMNQYYGLPDGIPALPAMAGKEAADEFNYAEFDNYGMARWAVIIRGSQLSKEARREIETFFEEDMNENAHGVLLVTIPPPPIPPIPSASSPPETTVEFQPLDVQQHEAHFQEYRHDLRDEVLAAHNVPPHLVSIIETGNIGGGQGVAQMQNFVKNVITPMKTKVEYQINSLIEVGFGIDWLKFTFNTSDLTAELDVAKISQIYSNVYAMTINEMRDRAGLDPVNGGDRIFLVIPGIGLIFVDDLDKMGSVFLAGGIGGLVAAPSDEGEGDNPPPSPDIPGDAAGDLTSLYPNAVWRNLGKQLMDLANRGSYLRSGKTLRLVRAKDLFGDKE